jgi:PTH1 family peptidyl-tRNA hydrolase
MVLAELADRMSANFKSHRTNSAVAEGRSSPGGPKLILAKPNTFMNVSGGPVAALLRFYSLEPSRLIVLHDDLDIPFDTVKLKLGGGHGGHNGCATSSPRSAQTTSSGCGSTAACPAAAIRRFRAGDFASTERATLPNLLADAVMPWSSSPPRADGRPAQVPHRLNA